MPKHTNPTDYYMKLMNKEGIMLSYIEKKQDYTDEQVLSEFEDRVKFFVTKFHDKKNQNI